MIDRDLLDQQRRDRIALRGGSEYDLPMDRKEMLTDPNEYDDLTWAIHKRLEELTARDPKHREGNKILWTILEAQENAEMWLEEVGYPLTPRPQDDFDDWVEWDDINRSKL